MDAAEFNHVNFLIELNGSKELDLNHNNLLNSDIVELSKALKHNSFDLQSVKLIGNYIGLEGALVIAEALKQNTTLQRINLGGNKLGSEGSQALAEALKQNKSLRYIVLSYNEIGGEGAQAIAEALKENTSLQVIDFFGNGIGDEGARALAEALKVNTSLQEINLFNTRIGEDGALAILEALKYNNTLLDIKLRSMYRDTKFHTIALVEAESKILKRLESNRLHRQCIKQLRRYSVTVWLAFRSMALPSTVLISLAEFAAYTDETPVMTVLSENERLREMLDILKFSKER